VPLRPEEGWALDLTAVEQALRPATKVVSVNYTTICNSAPSEILALIALRARDRILGRNRRIVADNLPVSVYRSALGPTLADRFRIGVGHLGAADALGHWASWLEKRR
jgi:hypothetical protein